MPVIIKSAVLRGLAFSPNELRTTSLQEFAVPKPALSFALNRTLRASGAPRVGSSRSDINAASFNRK